MMAAYIIKDRLVPYKILTYLLYSEDTREWIDVLGNNQVRIRTGSAAKFFRLKNSLLWDALYWLEKYKLVESIEKEKKRGSAIITLKSLSR
jgi:hypothetical protein